MNDKMRSLTAKEAAKRVSEPPHEVMPEHMAETWERIATEIDKTTQ
jgi:hypothetical protein